METNVPAPFDGRYYFVPVFIWKEIQLTRDTTVTTKLKFYYEISVRDLESIWQNFQDSGSFSFRTIFNFYVNATEFSGKILNVFFQCPVTLRRPKTVQGSFNNLETTFLSSNGAGSIDIDLSISATLVP